MKNKNQDSRITNPVINSQSAKKRNCTRANRKLYIALHMHPPLTHPSPSSTGSQTARPGPAQATAHAARATPTGPRTCLRAHKRGAKPANQIQPPQTNEWKEFKHVKKERGKARQADQVYADDIMSGSSAFSYNALLLGCEEPYTLSSYVRGRAALAN